MLQMLSQTSSQDQLPTFDQHQTRLGVYLPHDVAEQSLRPGGATSLAEAGVLPNVTQAIGRWASSAFQIYIRKNPVLLQAMLFGRPVHQHPDSGPVGTLTCFRGAGGEWAGVVDQMRPAGPMQECGQCSGLRHAQRVWKQPDGAASIWDRDPLE